MPSTTGENNSSTLDNKHKQSRVIEFDVFKKAQPRQRPFFAVCTGPYNIEFRTCICSQCGTESFVREYAAKILTLKDTTFPILSEDDREKAGQMDSIALAVHVVNAGVWVCSSRPNERIGLSSVHSALPRWLLHTTSKVVYGLERRFETPFARLAYTKTEIGGKTLISKCPNCEAELPAFQACAAMASEMSSSLRDDKGEPILYSWPVITSEISQSFSKS